VRLAALNLWEISGGSRDLKVRTVISGILRFHLNSLFSLFLHKCHIFRVNRRICDLICAWEFMRVTIPDIGSTFSGIRLLSGF